MDAHVSLEGKSSAPLPSRALGARVLVVGLVWLVLLRVLLDHLALWLPREIVRFFTLDTYVATIQVLVTALGVLLAFVALPSLRLALPFARPRPRQIATAIAIAPIVFCIGLGVGVIIALPTLIAEIEARGTDAGRQNLGELGRVLRESPVVITLLWGVIIAPITEELLFRGALWSGIQALVGGSSKANSAISETSPASRSAPASEAFDALPMDDGMLVRAGRSIGTWFLNGGIATLITTAIFGWMHADTPGGAGIIRVVSATFLGLIAGIFRQYTGSLLFGIALHITYNFFSVGHSRGWWIGDTFGSHFGIPTLIAVLGFISGVVLIVTTLALRPAKTVAIDE